MPRNVTSQERSTRLAERCGGDSELLEEVNSLLAAVDAADREASKAAEVQGVRGLRRWTPGLARTVGSISLERLIARGGMGASLLWPTRYRRLCPGNSF